MNHLFDGNEVTLILAVIFFFFVFRAHIMARILKVGEVGVHELASRLASATPPLLLDVRSQGEFDLAHIKQAKLVPLSELGRRLEEVKSLASGREVAVICHSGNRSLHGAVAMKRAGGAIVYSVAGGMAQWQGQGYPVSRNNR